MNHIKQIHAHALHHGFDQTGLLLDLLLRIPNLQYARRLIDSLPLPPPIFFCNKLLRSYSALPQSFCLCISLFSSMCAQLQYPPPNLYSFTFTISACATSFSPFYGRALHALLLKTGFPLDPFVSTSLVHMYSKTGDLPSARNLFEDLCHPDTAMWNSMITAYARSGDLTAARELFETMPTRNVISWTSLISGYSQNGMYGESIEMFTRMWKEGEMRPNEVTLTSILQACANAGAMELGEQIETFARENGLLENMFVGSALVEMYAKCGDVDRAMAVFREIGGQKNICSWNSMIMGLAVHGRWRESLQLFHVMKYKGIIPVDITFTGVLTACSHGGLVEEGKLLFQYMEKRLLISPKIQHYGCMVDLFGRAGLLNEAYTFIKRMPIEPDAAIWGALLAACSLHRNLELAEVASEALFKMEPWNTGNYVILANIYASAGCWDCVSKVWKTVKGRQQKKEAAYSLFELSGKMHKFLVEDKSHPNSKEIYTLLEMFCGEGKLCTRSYCLIGYAFLAIYLYPLLAVSVAVPYSNCYALDNSSHLVDFTDWIGHVFTHEQKDGDLVVRFCKDVEFRSQMGYIDFGRYETSSYFVAGSGSLNFIQGFFNGDLANCEHIFDKMGRTAQVNIICGDCLSQGCKDEFGCVCGVTYDASKCSVLVEIAIPCAKQGSLIFEGFTIGFHPRSWEVVYNGLTQRGFDKPHHEFSFGTDQSQVALYFTAISTLSSRVGKPSYKVSPDEGLEIMLSGSAASGIAPTTLSPSVLLVNWRCERIQVNPYEIYISIPVEGYDPIEFTLTKFCEYVQGREDDWLRGWATFGIVSLVLVSLLILSCCGGFIYKTRIEHQHGLYALPGVTFLSVCLESVNGSQDYLLGDGETERTDERRYGSI